MSFRTRLFSTSILIVATVMVAILFLSWTRIMQFEIKRLDTQLCIEAKRTADTSQKESLSTRLSDDLGAKLRIYNPQQLLLFVENINKEIYSQSDNWPQDFTINNLNWSDALPVPKTFSLKKNTQPPNKKNIETCQLAQFDQNQRQWRAVLYSQANTQSFIAVDLAVTKNELQGAVHSALGVVIPLALLLCALSAWLISNITMKPLTRLTNAMQAVNQKDFHHRLPENKEDNEFKILISSYNMMLTRLEKSFKQASRFSADAAHELKTPLTILRGQLEQAVRQGDSQQLDLNNILDEVGKLSAITRKLLLLSQADAGNLALHYEQIDLTTLLDELLTDLEFFPEGTLINSHIERELILNGDIILLRQLLNNLLSNALRYHLTDTEISISASHYNNHIEIIFSNDCKPISKATRKHLFDRFFRGDPAHNRSIDGNGLGLSLAKEIAKAHGGNLQLDETDNNKVSLRLRLPK
jgi:signal transduction histidine kinase